METRHEANRGNGDPDGRGRVGFAQIRLKGYEPIDGGAQITMEVSIEREGATKPVCVAEAVSRRFT